VISVVEVNITITKIIWYMFGIASAFGVVVLFFIFKHLLVKLFEFTKEERRIMKVMKSLKEKGKNLFFINETEIKEVMKEAKEEFKEKFVTKEELKEAIKELKDGKG